mmetsp:Transcript_4657/g.13465  ORF Transcript_4657/g.13465 Transcript_4657/m.13465 type:complete len:116 (-) Transcript_4657:3198-3545(-)
MVCPVLVEDGASLKRTMMMIQTTVIPFVVFVPSPRHIFLRRLNENKNLSSRRFERPSFNHWKNHLATTQMKILLKNTVSLLWAVRIRMPVVSNHLRRMNILLLIVGCNGRGSPRN